LPASNERKDQNYWFIHWEQQGDVRREKSESINFCRIRKDRKVFEWEIDGPGTLRHQETRWDLGPYPDIAKPSTDTTIEATWNSSGLKISWDRWNLTLRTLNTSWTFEKPALLVKLGQFYWTIICEINRKRKNSKTTQKAHINSFR